MSTENTSAVQATNSSDGILVRLKRSLNPDRSNKVLWLTSGETKVAIGACVAYAVIAGAGAYAYYYSYVHHGIPTLEGYFKKLPSKSTLKSLGAPSSIHTLAQFRTWLLKKLNLPTSWDYTQFANYLQSHKAIDWVAIAVSPALVLALMIFGTWYRRRAPLIFPMALAGLALTSIGAFYPSLIFLGFAIYLTYKAFTLRNNPSGASRDTGSKASLNGKKPEAKQAEKKSRTSPDSPLAQVRQRRATGRYTPPKKRR